MSMSAIFSDDGLYRYRLDRASHTGETVMFIGVNPSTADAANDDPTIRKMRRFAFDLNRANISVGNLFAYRAADVRQLRMTREPIGPDNDAWLRSMMRDADTVIACWGPVNKVPPAWRERWRTVWALSKLANKPLHCLGTCKDGHPRHPLMLAYSTPLTVWTPP